MGFSISELVQSRKWKLFMSKVYGWGATVVLIGAMFKIMHWPGSGFMLVAGLSTEAFIFFTSAFEPLHEEVDWSLVYPELAGLHEDDEDGERPTGRHNRGGGGGGSTSALQKFDEMIEKAEITPELFEKLGQGLQNLHQTTEKLSNVADVTLVTDEYVNSFKNAADAANKLADVNNNVAEKGNELAVSYEKLTGSMNQEFERTTEGNKSYGEQLDIMTKNLTALNAVYEMQLDGANKHVEASKAMYDGLDEMMDNLKASVEDTKKYREEISKLGTNLAAMNTVYGNMLAAMNVNVNN